MLLSKHQLAGKGSPNFRYRKLAEIFKFGKTAAAIILNEEKSIRSQS